jgi:hypothetical protein
LRRAILRVLHEPQYRDASRRIATDMVEAPGLAGLTAIVDDVVRDMDETVAP